MPTITCTNVSGTKQRSALSTTAAAFSVVPGTDKRGGARVQLVCNAAWLYADVDEGATADNWLSVPAGAALTFDTGSRAFAFFAKSVVGTPNLHFLEL